MRRQWFYTSLQGQHQPSAVIGKTTVAIAVPGLRKAVDVAFEFTQLGMETPPARIPCINHDYAH